MTRSDLSPSPFQPVSDWVVAFALFFPSLLTWTYFVALADSPTTIQQIVYTGGKVLQFTLPVVLVAVVLRRRPEIPWSWRRNLGEGILSGLAILVMIVAIWQTLIHAGSPLLAELVPNISAKLVDLGIVTPWRYFGLAVFYSLFHTFLEEYYWRWFVYGQLRLRMGVFPATVVSSLGFMAHHVIVMGAYAGWTSPYTYLFSAAVAVGGSYWAWLYERSRSIVAPWVSHLFVDIAIFAVGRALVS